MKTKNVLSYPREAWVIPNGHGQLWTDRIFDSEAEAQAQVDKIWDEIGLTGTKHRPVKASVRVTAKPILSEGADDA